MRSTLRERLLSRLVADPDTGCLLWTGCLNSRGYGVIGVHGTRQLVHRVAWQLEKGPIPESLTIDHVHDRGCRHKHCANIAHLEPVTQAENNQRALPFRNRTRVCKPQPENWSWLTAFREWAGPEEYEDLAVAQSIPLSEVDAWINGKLTAGSAS